MSDKTRYFTHVDGFAQGVAFVRYDPNDDPVCILLTGAECDCMIDIEVALSYVAKGGWKEISAEDAAALLVKPEQCEQCASLIEALEALFEQFGETDATAHPDDWRAYTGAKAALSKAKGEST